MEDEVVDVFDCSWDFPLSNKSDRFITTYTQIELFLTCPFHAPVNRHKRCESRAEIRRDEVAIVVDTITGIAFMLDSILKKATGVSIDELLTCTFNELSEFICSH